VVLLKAVLEILILRLEGQAAFVALDKTLAAAFSLMAVHCRLTLAGQ